jgi:DNA-binding transcriptional ArsR family regulator
VRPPTSDLADRLVKAIAHPLRQQVLAEIQDAGEASPVAIAGALGQPLGRVSHHVRVLADVGAIELVRTRQRRGATQHFYRAVVLPWYDDSAWRRLPLETRRAVFGATLERLVADMAAAARSGGFDDLQAHVSYTRLDLDEEGMRAVVELLGETLDRIQAIKLATGERLGDGPPLLRTELGIVHFERE